MRRPAQHRLGPTPAPGWAHPYTGPLALAVFYNDGGGNPTQPPANEPPKPGPPPAAPAPASGDAEVSLTQRRLNVLMKSEKDEGRRAAYRQIAEAAGVDPETFDPAKFGDLFKQVEQARQAQLTEEQRRAEELAQREKDLEQRMAQAEQREAEAARRDRDSRIRAALVSRGATGDDLEDAAALLRVADDADDTAIGEAADALKTRRGELFGTSGPQPGQMPPAPGGAPAGGPPPRQASSGKPGDRGREMARLRGHVRNNPAA
jgi:hypothetical protein